MHELLYLKDEQIKEFIEKLFFAYRESFSDAKKALNKHSLGLAHHKVIHLLSIYEGITISELLKNDKNYLMKYFQYKKKEFTKL